MTSREQYEKALYDLLQQKSAASECLWSRAWGKNESVQAVIEEGIKKLAALVGDSTLCALHGWIDQAVLEIRSIAALKDLSGEATSYRPDEGGDSGIAALLRDTGVVLEISFERQSIAISRFEFEKAQQAGCS